MNKTQQNLASGGAMNKTVNKMQLPPNPYTGVNRKSNVTKQKINSQANMINTRISQARNNQKVLPFEAYQA
jgi:hypothetical protein